MGVCLSAPVQSNSVAAVTGSRQQARYAQDKVNAASKWKQQPRLDSPSEISSPIGTTPQEFEQLSAGVEADAHTSRQGGQWQGVNGGTSSSDPTLEKAESASRTTYQHAVSGQVCRTQSPESSLALDCRCNDVLHARECRGSCREHKLGRQNSADLVLDWSVPGIPSPRHCFLDISLDWSTSGLPEYSFVSDGLDVSTSTAVRGRGIRLRHMWPAAILLAVGAHIARGHLISTFAGGRTGLLR